jgi:Flp pilus assembly pilin Flp
MKNFLKTLWREDDGVLSFEWVLLTTIIVIGIVGGLTAARDAVIDELGDAAEAMIAMDQSYQVDFPLLVGVNCSDAPDVPIASQASNSGFLDTAEFIDCDRITIANQQGPETD